MYYKVKVLNRRVFLLKAWTPGCTPGCKNCICSVSVQPKPGFGIGNQNQSPISVSVLEPKGFFFKNFLCFPAFSGGISFIKPGIDDRSSKII